MSKRLCARLRTPQPGRLSPRITPNAGKTPPAESEMPMFQWRRGSTFNLGLRVKSGTVTGTEGVTCWVKKAVNGRSPGDEVEPAAILQTTFVAADRDTPAHWLFTGTAEQSIALQIGQYVADARIELAGGVIQTEPVLIEVVERVTEGG